MTDYGIQPTGYVRKPLAIILAELEAAMITEFGPGVIQTSQSPFGQLNGLMADLVAKIDEHNLDLYQSFDPDQAEGVRLDILGNIRLVNRNTMNDFEYRKVISNAGVARIDIQDIAQALKNINGVTFSRVFINDTGEFDDNDFKTGSLAISVIGGNDDEIGDVLRKYVVPGIKTYGNTRIESSEDGYCRSYMVIRPILIPVTLNVQVSLFRSTSFCPPPSLTSIRETLVTLWNETRYNGKGVSEFTVRSLLESEYEGLEVVRLSATRDGLPVDNLVSSDVDISFFEIASLSSDDVEVIEV